MRKKSWELGREKTAPIGYKPDSYRLWEKRKNSEKPASERAIILTPSEARKAGKDKMPRDEYLDFFGDEADLGAEARGYYNVVKFTADIGVEPEWIAQMTDAGWKVDGKYIEKDGKRYKAGKILSRLAKKDDRWANLLKDYSLHPEKSNYTVYISDERDDMLNASTWKGWTSCTEAGKVNYDSLECGWASGDLIAYAIRGGGSNWSGRLILRHDGSGKFWPEDMVYSDDSSLSNNKFYDAVVSWLKGEGMLSETWKLSPEYEGWTDSTHSYKHREKDFSDHKVILENLGDGAKRWWTGLVGKKESFGLGKTFDKEDFDWNYYTDESKSIIYLNLTNEQKQYIEKHMGIKLTPEINYSPHDFNKDIPGNKSHVEMVINHPANDINIFGIAKEPINDKRTLIRFPSYMYNMVKHELKKGGFV